MHNFRAVLLVIFVVFFLLACEIGVPAAQDTNALATKIASDIFATQTADSITVSQSKRATFTPKPTKEPTQEKTATAQPSSSPKSIITPVDSQVLFVCVDTVNIRSGPATTFDVLAKATSGKTVTVIGTAGDWSYVGKNKDGQDGFVISSALCEQKPSPAQPTQPPAPSFAAQTQQIGPIHNSSRDEDFSMEITVNNVKTYKGDNIDTPKSGNTFVIVYIHIHNLGPGTAHDVYTTDFQMKDSNGAIRGEANVYAARDCALDLIDLAGDGSIDGCVTYEVPAQGHLEFIYAPYQFEGLKPGRYLSFTIRD